MSTKDGNLSFGESNIELKEKITPPLKLSPDEEKYNRENEWLKAIEEGDLFRGARAINTKRIPTRYVSRSQRISVRGEKHGPAQGPRNKKQRKAIS